MTTTTTAECSLLERMTAALGAARTRDELRARPLQDFCEVPLPEEWRRASAWDALGWIWSLHARPSQLVPADAPRIVLVRSGRGFGKNRLAAEHVNIVAQQLARLVERGALQREQARILMVGRAEADTRDTMVLGDSGVIARSPPWHRAEHLPGSRRVRWPSGVEALTFSASEPSQLRGMNAAFTWCDEVASWGTTLEETWINIEAATRVGPLPTKILATTTPRPLPWLKEFIKRPDVLDVRRPTKDNIANLAAGVVDALYARFGGAVAAQELDGEIVDITAASWFPPADARIIDAAPGDIGEPVRAWDLAATAPSDATPDPDWSCGVLMARRASGRFVVLHATFLRAGPAAVEDLIRRTAELDGAAVPIVVPQDPGQAGKSQVSALVGQLAGFAVTSERPTGSKELRAQAFSAQWQHGNVDVVRGSWNEQVLSQLGAFPGGFDHDDAVDACSSAFNRLSVERAASMWDVL